MSTSSAIVPYQGRVPYQGQGNTILSEAAIKVRGYNTWGTAYEKIVSKLALSICTYVTPVYSVVFNCSVQVLVYGGMALTAASIQNLNPFILLNPQVGIILAVIVVANAVLHGSLALSLSILKDFMAYATALGEEAEKEGARDVTIDYTDQDLSVSQLKDLLNENPSLDTVGTLKIKVRSEGEICELTEYLFSDARFFNIDVNFFYLGASHPIDIPIPEKPYLEELLKCDLEILVTLVDVNAAFTTLGLSPNCTEAELKCAYQKRLLQCHPDKAGSNPVKNFLNSGGMSIDSVQQAKAVIDKYTQAV